MSRTEVPAELVRAVEAVFTHPSASTTTRPTGPEPDGVGRADRHPCRCGHQRIAHTHYSQSTHCACCRCLHFQRRRRLSVDDIQFAIGATVAITLTVAWTALAIYGLLAVIGAIR